VDSSETFSTAEISAVTGASVKAVYKVIGERLPRGLSVQRDRQQYLTRWGAVCFVIDREMPKDVPLAVRRKLYACILADSNEGGHLFRSDRGHHSNLMAASLASSRGPGFGNVMAPQPGSSSRARIGSHPLAISSRPS
jgi:hypothetical protein